MWLGTAWLESWPLLLPHGCSNEGICIYLSTAWHSFDFIACMGKQISKWRTNNPLGKVMMHSVQLSVQHLSHSWTHTMAISIGQ